MASFSARAALELGPASGCRVLLFARVSVAKKRRAILNREIGGFGERGFKGDCGGVVEVF